MAIRAPDGANKFSSFTITTGLRTGAAGKQLMLYLTWIGARRSLHIITNAAKNLCDDVEF